MVTREGAIFQREISKSIRSFSSDVQFGIVFYNTSVSKFPSTGHPSIAIPRNKKAAYNFLDTINGSPGGCPGSGLHESLLQANQSTAGNNIIIYLSNGGTVCPGADPAEYAQQTLADVARWNYRKLRIHCIVVGAEVQEDFPRKLAAATGGTYKRIVQ